MPQIMVVDTNILIGATVENDEYHSRAKPIFDQIDQGELPKVLVTDTILMEVVNILNQEFNSSRVNDVIERLESSPNFRLSFVEKALYERARSEIFREHPPLSLVDSTLVSVMGEYSLEYIYSFDDDFDAVGGINRINADVNPFN